MTSNDPREEARVSRRALLVGGGTLFGAALVVIAVIAVIWALRVLL